MAILLQTQLTLNPGNQIAHMADMTGLTPFMEYNIVAQYLQPGTRFVFQGNLDITLTLPPVGVPANNTVVPAQVEDIPAPAPVPPPATYPYTVKDRLQAHYLNLDLENTPAATPPHNVNGGAHLGRLWLDTSTNPPNMRICAVAQASPTYVPAEWYSLVEVTGGGSSEGQFLPITGGIIQGSLSVTGNLSTNGSLSVVGNSAISGNQTVTGTASFATGGVLINHNGIQYPGIGDNNYLSFNWNGQYVQEFVDGNHVGDIVHSNYPGGVILGGALTVNGNNINVGGATLYNNGGYLYSPNYMRTPGFQCDGNINASGSLGVSGTVSGNGIYANGGLGVDYTGVPYGGYWFGFGWDGRTHVIVNGGDQGRICLMDGGGNMSVDGNLYINNQLFCHSLGNGGGDMTIGCGVPPGGNIGTLSIFANQVNFTNNIHCDYMGGNNFGFGEGNVGGVTFPGGGTISTGGAVYAGYAGINGSNISNAGYTTGCSGSGDWIGLGNAGGNNLGLFINAGLVGYLISSGCGAELKHSFAPIEVDCLAAVNRIALQQFDWHPTHGKMPGREDEIIAQLPHWSCGFTAQQVREVIPEVFPEAPEPYLLIAYLIGSVQQLTAQVAALEGRK